MWEAAALCLLCLEMPGRVTSKASQNKDLSFKVLFPPTPHPHSSANHLPLERCSCRLEHGGYGAGQKVLEEVHFKSTGQLYEALGN